VQQERIKAGRGVVVAGRVAGKRSRTRGRVLEACRGAVERVKTERCIGRAAREAEEGVCPFSGIEVGIASVRCRRNSSGPQRKPKAAERRGNENWQNCWVFKRSRRILGCSFLFLITDFGFSFSTFFESSLDTSFLAF